MFHRSELLSLVIFVIFMKTEMSCASTKESSNPSDDFKKHTIFKPIIHHGLTKREILTTKHESGLHLPEVNIVVSHKKGTLVLELRRQEDLVAERHALYYQPPVGAGLLVADNEEVEWCHYRGSVRHRAGSWSAVSTCHGVRGVVFDGRNVWYIQPADEDSNITSDHYLYNGRDVTTTHRCGHQHVDYGTDFLHGAMANHQQNETHAIRYKRDASETKKDEKIHEPYSANGKSQYVELVLVADNKAYQKLDSNLGKVHAYFIQLANTLNVLFSSLNVYIALVGVVVWNERNPIHLNGTNMLSLFAGYRAKSLVSIIPHDTAHLLTGVPFDNPIMAGAAYVGAICNNKYSAGVSTFYTMTMTTTVAHELGHTLGFHHDKMVKDCACPLKNCIMNGGSTGWSECNKKTIETRRLSKHPDTCLFNKPRSLFAKFCGNGFVEPGEQCDCGVTVPGHRLVTNAACHMCCDPNTCRLRGNATIKVMLCRQLLRL